MIDLTHITQALDAQAIGLRSRACGNSGTRFQVIGSSGTPADPFDKVSDAAPVHQFTGMAPTVRVHISWDAVDSFSDLAKHTEDNAVALDMANRGQRSLVSGDKAVRRRRRQPAPRRGVP